MKANRTILHCDCNGFYASVETVLNPELSNVPMAVCGNPENRRGIILAKNELAKKYKIQTAETVWKAKQKCPDLVLVPPHYDEYVKFSRMINKIYEQYTNLVEPFGIDESWLDVTDSFELFGDGKKIADTLRETVRNELGLTISVGVSFNKIFAKLGSDYKKPDATTVIDRQNFKQIVYPLPVSDLLYVGKTMARELAKIGVFNIGQLSKCEKSFLESKYGKMGSAIYDYALGFDESPVKSIDEDSKLKSVGNGMTFRRNLTGDEDILIGITTLADTVGARMRSYGLKCNTVQVSIKDPDFKVINKQKALDRPTNLSKEIREVAFELVKACWKENKPIRMLSVTGTNLVSADDSIEQLSLFSEKNDVHDKEEKLENAIDNIRNKFGKDSIKLANIINSDLFSDKSE